MKQDVKVINKQRRLETGIIVLISLLLLFVGCATEPGGPSVGRGTATGAGVDAAAGAVLGAVTGNNVKGISKAEGAIAGAVVGGLLGGVIGNQRDAMARQNASVNQRLSSAEQQANTAVVNIANSNGSTTPVMLHRSGNQWIGPRGEVYNNMPTEAQLKPVYGF